MSRSKIISDKEAVEIIQRSTTTMEACAETMDQARELIMLQRSVLDLIRAERDALCDYALAAMEVERMYDEGVGKPEFERAMARLRAARGQS